MTFTVKFIIFIVKYVRFSIKFIRFISKCDTFTYKWVLLQQIATAREILDDVRSIP